MVTGTNRELRQLNARFEELADDWIFTPAEASELTPEKSKARRKLADKDEFQFCEIYFPNIFNEPFNDLHEWARDCQVGERYTMSGHRKCGKSAYIYIAKAVRHIVLEGLGVVGVGSATIQTAKERSARLYRLIKNNQKLMYDYKPRIIQEEKGHYIINQCHIVATSVETGLRSIEDDEFRRFLIFIADDLYNRMTVASDKWCKKCVDFVEYEVDGQMEHDGTAWILGNSITTNAPVRTLKKRRPENHFSFPHRDKDGETNWKDHSIFTTEYWDEFEKITPASVIAGDYADEPYDIGDTFQPAWIRWVNVNTIKIVASISAIDPSQGKSPSANYKSITTMGLAEDGKRYNLDMYLKKEDWRNVFDYIQELRFNTPAWKILWFENDFAQWELAMPYYREWRKVEGNKFIPMIQFLAKDLATEHFGADKIGRIMNLVFPHQIASLLYSDTIKGTIDYERFYAQYLAFGGENQNMKDGLDSMATAYIKLDDYENGGHAKTAFKSLAKRIFDKDRNWFR